MRQNYVIPIANALKQFDNSSESDFSYYENLAWSGLHQKLTNAQKAEVQKA